MEDKGVGEPGLQRPQFLQDVQAADAAEGPEVEDHHATAQAGQAQRFAAGVQPPSAGQLRRPDTCEAHADSTGSGRPNGQVRPVLRMHRARSTVNRKGWPPARAGVEAGREARHSARWVATVVSG